jgi:hypothetical protein
MQHLQVSLREHSPMSPGRPHIRYGLTKRTTFDGANSVFTGNARHMLESLASGLVEKKLFF